MSKAFDSDILCAVLNRAETMGADRSTLALAIITALSPRDLARLVTFGDADFIHDIGGILAYLNPRTDRLEGGFLPRCVS
jgi:hypothetical protein